MPLKAKKILARYRGKSLEESALNNVVQEFPEGKDRDALVKVRVNQSFFRNAVLASYNNHCCITGIEVPELLVAGHIIPWAENTKERVNPANGLCLNALHDKAFDKGLMTITPDYVVKLSSELSKNLIKNSSETFFRPFEGKRISLPQKFVPKMECLEYHNRVIFKP